MISAPAFARTASQAHPTVIELHKADSTAVTKAPTRCSTCNLREICPVSYTHLTLPTIYSV